ncbi:MAG: arylsulfatase [Novosphingobium sp.]
MRKFPLLCATMLAFASPALGDAVEPAAKSAPAQAPQQQQRPNVLVWMLDDVGFAQLGCFGGLIPTPNIDRVARMGLRYNNYYTPPICSASRAAILSGRMPHTIHVGGHAAASRPYPGYNAKIPPEAGTVAANLKAAGYATYALGKWDHLPTEEITPAGPHTRWPTGQGFERFYGFLSADTDNFHPTLIRDQSPVATPDSRDYHLSADLADQAIRMIGNRNAAAEKRPFFMYWATGAAHAPHHAPADWIARFKGKFDMGWDKAREEILKHQKAQGLVPQNARLAPRPPEMPAWDSLSAEQKSLFARQMEAFAAQLSHADAQFGRILDAIEASGELDNTLVIVTSDNGASAEGGPNGLYNEIFMVMGQPSIEANMRFFDDWGGPKTYPHYSYGWAVAGNTPFRYYKQTTHMGGIHVPLVLAWPTGIAARGEMRGQFTHVSDIAATILEVTGTPLATTINNVPQMPLDGISFAYSFTDAKAPSPRKAQYFEMYGNKALVAGDWSIVTSHRNRTWTMAPGGAPNEPWELYNLKTDIGQANDLAKRDPAKVAELAALFDEQAERYHVNPVGDIGEGTANAMRKGREDFARRDGKWRYSGPVADVTGQMGPPVSALGYRMTARLDLPSAHVTGPIFAFGGQLGGVALYLREGRPVFIANALEGDGDSAASSEALPAGKSDIELEVRMQAGAVPGMAVPHAIIRSGGRVLAEKTLSHAIPASFGIAETFGVGIDTGSPVMAGQKSDMPFAGGISDVIFDFAAGE